MRFLTNYAKSCDLRSIYYAKSQHRRISEALIQLRKSQTSMLTSLGFTVGQPELSLKVNMVLGDAVTKLQTFVWTFNHVSRLIT